MLPQSPESLWSHSPSYTPYSHSSPLCSCISSFHHKGQVYCIAVCGDLVLTGSSSRKIRVWHSSSHGLLEKGYIQSSSSDVRAMLAQDGTVKLWLRIYGEFSHTLIKVICFHANPIYALALSISPPSQNQTGYLYFGSFEGSLNFAELETISCEYNHGNRIVKGHQFAVLCLVALENFVISGSEDSTIRVWRRSSEERGMESHECVAVLEGHRGPVRCLGARLQKESFHAMSLLVFSASLDQTFKVWRVQLELQEINIYSPNRRSNANDYSMEGGRNSLEFEGSPVLSPAWVKKKLQDPSIH
ncbi:Protein JINGUBANG [Bienertia sinuspersici]